MTTSAIMMLAILFIAMAFVGVRLMEVGNKFDSTVGLFVATVGGVFFVLFMIDLINGRFY